MDKTKNKEINTIIDNGVSRQIIENVYAEHNLLEIKKKLLKPLVKDNELLEILVQPINLNKIKHRFSYNMEFITDENENIAKMFIANLTPEQCIHLIKKTSLRGEFIDSEWIEKFKNKGFQGITQYKTKVYLSKCRLTLFFKKGK